MFWTQRTGYSVVAILLFSSAVSAQSINIYNSGGFEGPTFTNGAPLGGYNPSFTPGGQVTSTQDNWNNTDQLLIIPGFPPIGEIQTGLVQSGSQAVRIHGERLTENGTFEGGNFWWRYPDFAGNVFNPLANNTPVVVAQTGFYRNDAQLTTDIPLKGMYFEGLRTGGLQRVITQVGISATGTVYAMTLNAFPNSTVESAPDLVPNQTWVDLRVQMNFQTQTFQVFLNNTLLGFGPGQVITNVPFRDSDIGNGQFDRLREYGYVAYYNTAAGITTGDTYFDNFSIIAVPEPASLALMGFCIACGGMLYYRKQVSSKKQADMEVEVTQ